MDTRDLDHPCRGAGVETRFSDALQCASDEWRDDSKRQQVRDTGECAARQAREEGNLASAAVGEGAGEKSCTECYERKRTDNEADNLVGPSEIVSNVRRQPG